MYGVIIIVLYYLINDKLDKIKWPVYRQYPNPNKPRYAQVLLLL